MPKKCDGCGFFHPENEMSQCPQCGQALKFTMFVPPGFETKEIDDSRTPETWNHEQAKYEQLELSWGVRWAQICAGVFIYCLISRYVCNVFCAAVFIGDSKLELRQMMIAFLAINIAFHLVGSLAGGAVAGAWSVNWVPQGIGMGVGVFILPLVMYYFFGLIHGVSLIAFLIIVCITTACSVLGAWIGHKVVRPSRYVIS
jgi:hypothetical protein